MSSDFEVTPLALYVRCYERMTGLSIPYSDPIRQLLISGQGTHQDAVQGCMDLLHLASFDTSSRILRNVNAFTAQNTASEKLKKSVVRTFDNLHRSFFPNDSFEQTFSGYTGIGSQDVIDESEPGAYFTRALFQCNSFDGNGRCQSYLHPSEAVLSGNMLEVLRQTTDAALTAPPTIPPISQSGSATPLLTSDFTQRNCRYGVDPSNYCRTPTAIVVEQLGTITQFGVRLHNADVANTYVVALPVGTAMTYAAIRNGMITAINNSSGGVAGLFVASAGPDFSPLSAQDPDQSLRTSVIVQTTQATSLFGVYNVTNSTGGATSRLGFRALPEAQYPVANHRFPLFTGVNFNPFVLTGDVIGVRPMESSPRWNLNVRSRGNQLETLPTDRVWWNRGFGGGVLGSQAYLLQNFGYQEPIAMDGGAKMPRRYIQSIFKNLLCRETPPLQIQQVLAYVNTTNPALPTFRQSASCLGCHVTYDWAAAALRNHHVRLTHGTGAFTTGFVDLAVVHQTPAPMGGYQPEIPAAAGPYWPWAYPDPSASFHLRQARGRLIFNSVDGSVFDRQVTGIAELADAIADTPDFYACVASKYLNFFTGIEADLRPLAEIPSVERTAEAMHYRDLVLNLGEQLHQGGNAGISALVRDILNSDIYRQEDLRRD